MSEPKEINQTPAYTWECHECNKKMSSYDICNVYGFMPIAEVTQVTCLDCGSLMFFTGVRLLG